MDIVEKLHARVTAHKLTDNGASASCLDTQEAADEIERLRAALKPFSAMAGELFARNWNNEQIVVALDNPGDPHRLTAKDFFEARRVIATDEQIERDK